MLPKSVPSPSSPLSTSSLSSCEQSITITLNFCLNEARLCMTETAPILVTGDSADADLTLGRILSHILHPPPRPSRPSPSSVPLRGVMLVSPWVSFSEALHSMAANSRKDSVDVTVLRKRSRYFVRRRQARPLQRTLFSRLRSGGWRRWNAAREWLVTAGGNECLIDW